MTARQARLFDDLPPRKTRGYLMHVTDAGIGEAGGHNCFLTCARCGAESGWLKFDTVTEAKRGLPCPRCNAPKVGPDGTRRLFK